MASDPTNAATNFPNPLQNNNAALAVIGYVAGVVAVKFPIFDFATWNYIFMSLGGVVFVGLGYAVNRKSAVISTVANLPEVNNVDLNKSVPGATALAAVSPDNVVAK